MTHAYDQVNTAWPAGTHDGRDLVPTAQEAASAARRLYRFAMKRPWRGKVVVTSGNRFTWITNGVLYVNPNQRGTGGWHEIVHGLAHYCGYRLYPGKPQHGPQHFWLELQMVRHVVASGWLDGKLRRHVPDTPKPDRKAIHHARLAERIRRWEAKERRATTALRKLRRAARRCGEPVQNAG